MKCRMNRIGLPFKVALSLRDRKRDGSTARRAAVLNFDQPVLRANGLQL